MPNRHDSCLIAINQQVDHARLEHFGSGILIRLQNLHFLFSAAHVLVKDRLWLPGKPSMPLDKTGRIFASTPFDGTPHTDLFDLAYVLLSEKAVTALTALGRTFLDSSELVISLPPIKTAVCVFTGIPCSKSRTIVGRQEIIAQPNSILSEAFTTAELVAFGRDPKNHVGIRYDRERLADDRTGSQVIGPIPDGMSGGPIWLVPPDGTPKLWAIGTDYDLQKKGLFGSKIEPLLKNILVRHFPPGN